MASSSLPPPSHLASLMPLTVVVIALVLLQGKVPSVIAQAATVSGGCGGPLMLLVPCGPFVQGMADSPSLACCDNLVNLYRNRRSCLCLLLNQSNSLPINHSLALQLPTFCNLTAHASTCLQDGSPQQAQEGSSTANSPAVSPAVAVEVAFPSRSGGNQLLEMGSGGRLRVEANSPMVLVVMVVLVLA